MEAALEAGAEDFRADEQGYEILTDPGHFEAVNKAVETKGVKPALAEVAWIPTITVPLTYDLDIAATKFCHGVADGAIPLLLLFSGTVYYQGETGVQVGQVPWSEEAPYPLPVATWRAAMDDHYPGSTYIRLSRATVDALSAYRSKHVITTWDETLERLLKEAP